MGFRFCKLSVSKCLPSAAAIYAAKACIGRLSIKALMFGEAFLSAFVFVTWCLFGEGACQV